MTSPPSLRTRLLLVSLTALAVAVIALDALVYLTWAGNGEPNSLRRLLVIEGIGTAVLIVIAVFVLRRVTTVMVRPVEELAATADAIAGGDTSQRLRASDQTTELGRVAGAFDRTVDQMEAALAESRASQAASRRFLSDAAHQLRTPVAGLRASAESLLRDPTAADRDRMLANIARESVRASRMIDSLLRVARLDRGEHTVTTDVDLAAIVRAEHERAASLAPSLTVEIAIDDDADGHGVQADRDGIVDAIANLLDNARRHATSSISIHVGSELGAVHVVVDDDGPGVPEGREDDVFERFISLAEGSGLGLAIARGVARAHGGDLTVRGSRFVLVIPRVMI